MNIPSGVNDKAVTPEFMVMENLDLVSDDLPFQMLIALSSPADASNRSASSPTAAGTGKGCQINPVITPWWALKE